MSLEDMSLADRIAVIRAFFPDSQGADLMARLQQLEQAILANEGEGKAEREQAFQRFLLEEKERLRDASQITLLPGGQLE